MTFPESFHHTAVLVKLFFSRKHPLHICLHCLVIGCQLLARIEVQHGEFFACLAEELPDFRLVILHMKKDVRLTVLEYLPHKAIIGIGQYEDVLLEIVVQSSQRENFPAGCGIVRKTVIVNGVEHSLERFMTVRRSGSTMEGESGAEDSGGVTHISISSLCSVAALLVPYGWLSLA